MPLESVITQSSTPATVGSGTKIAADALSGGEVVQYVKLISGVNGEETPVAAGANGLYVDLRAAVPLTVNAHAVTISGTPAVSVSNWPATQPISGTVSVGNFPATQSVSGTVSISGTPNVSVTNFPATQPVSGTFWQATQPVSIAGTVPVSISSPVLGQAAMAGSLPVVIATNQSPIPITGSITTTAGPADKAAFTAGTTPVTPTGYLMDENPTVVPTQGQVGAARVDPYRQQIMVIGDYGNPYQGKRAGVTTNHELQVAANLLTLSGSAVGQQAMAGSLPVVIAANQSPIPIIGSISTTAGPADNAPYVFGTTPVTPTGYVLDETSTNVPTENSVAAARMDAKRAQVMVIEDMGTGGVTRRAGVSIRNALQIEGVSGGTAVPTFVGTTNVAIPAWGHQVISNPSGGYGVLQAVRASNALLAGNLNGYATIPMADLFSRLITVPLAPRELVADATITLTTTTETTLIAATAAEFHDLTEVVCSNASTTVDTRVDFRDTTTGTVRFSLFVPAKATVGFQLPTPRPQAVVNTNWTAQCGTAGADVRVYAQYVRNK